MKTLFKYFGYLHFKKMYYSILTVIIVGLISSIPFSNTVVADATPNSTIYEVLQDNSEFSKYLSLIEKAGLEETFKITGIAVTNNLVVLAPTNEAFNMLDTKKLETIENNTELLKKLVLYHVMYKDDFAYGIKYRLPINTFEQENLVPTKLGKLRMNRSASIVNVYKAPINGTVLAIDDVLIPKYIKNYIKDKKGIYDLFPDLLDTLENNNEFDTFVSLIKEAELEDLFEGYKPYVVFAPTDKAFESFDKIKLARIKNNKELLINLIEYHVADMRKIIRFVNHDLPLETIQGEVIESDKHKGILEFNNDVFIVDTYKVPSNGSVYAIDDVFVPEYVQNSLDNKLMNNENIRAIEIWETSNPLDRLKTLRQRLYSIENLKERIQFMRDVLSYKN